jgi:hypothetical protein
VRDEVIMDNESYDVSTGILYACGVISQWRVASAAVALFAVVMVSVVIWSRLIYLERKRQLPWVPMYGVPSRVEMAGLVLC